MTIIRFAKAIMSCIPHMASVEATLYPELDRLLSCRLAMTPMAREHDQIRDLVVRLGAVSDRSRATQADEPSSELARILRQLHDVLDRHLREEARYVPILEHNLGAAETSTLAAVVDQAGRGAF